MPCCQLLHFPSPTKDLVSRNYLNYLDLLLLYTRVQASPPTAHGNASVLADVVLFRGLTAYPTSWDTFTHIASANISAGHRKAVLKHRNLKSEAPQSYRRTVFKALKCSADSPALPRTGWVLFTFNAEEIHGAQGTRRNTTEYIRVLQKMHGEEGRCRCGKREIIGHIFDEAIEEKEVG
ncbi:hypothetical protein Anapl_01085 [Anas platyrhynchos]|uniref:Uncharacterized protein n=1 Tax=Anas platyrhynchos TaxID=8839 RepID=R0LDY6_ANAPL|nr:hypothetical protein Anapl_01085 [Anas platyrhynchos]